MTGDVSISATAVIADQPEQIQKKVVSEKDSKKLNAAVKELRKSPKAKKKKPVQPTPADTIIADQIRNQRQQRIVSLIIEGLGKHETELLNMLTEGEWDGSVLFCYLMDRLKERRSQNRKPGT